MAGQFCQYCYQLRLLMMIPILLMNRHQHIRLVLATLPLPHCSHLRHYITTFTLTLPPQTIRFKHRAREKPRSRPFGLVQVGILVAMRSRDRILWGIWNASLLPGATSRPRAAENWLTKTSLKCAGSAQCHRCHGMKLSESVGVNTTSN